MNAPSLLDRPLARLGPLRTGGRTPWDLARVAHLHRRAGFAAPWSILQRDLADGPAASVDRLLDGEPTSVNGQSAADFAAMLDDMAGQLAPGANLTRLQGIWLYRMIYTPHPLLERMTLFWHNHFATSHAKVKNTALMQRQNDLLRSHALGNFKAMLAEIGKDPGHADLARLHREPQGASQRELRPRGDGAVHAGTRPLHREGHPGGRPGLHRLVRRPGPLQRGPRRSTIAGRRRSSAGPGPCAGTTSRRSCSTSRPARSSSAASSSATS